MHLDVIEEHKFRRCFFAFQACLLGFIHCRPMIMVDGTFLKGRHKGCLLSAVAKDDDEGNVLYICCSFAVGGASDFICSCMIG